MDSAADSQRGRMKRPRHFSLVSRHVAKGLWTSLQEEVHKNSEEVKRVSHLISDVQAHMPDQVLAEILIRIEALEATSSKTASTNLQLESHAQAMPNGIHEWRHIVDDRMPSEVHGETNSLSEQQLKVTANDFKQVKVEVDTLKKQTRNLHESIQNRFEDIVSKIAHELEPAIEACKTGLQEKISFEAHVACSEQLEERIARSISVPDLKLESLKAQLIDLHEIVKGKVSEEVHRSFCTKMEESLLNVTTATHLKVSLERFDELHAKVYRQLDPVMEDCSSGLKSLQHALRRSEKNIADNVMVVERLMKTCQLFDETIGSKASNEILQSAISKLDANMQQHFIECRSLAEGRVTREEFRDLVCSITEERRLAMATLTKQFAELQIAVEEKVSEEAYTASRRQIDAKIAEVSAVTSLKASQQQFEDLCLTVTEQLEPKLVACSTQLNSLQDALKHSDNKMETDLQSIANATSLKVSQEHFDGLVAKVFGQMEPAVVACSTQLNTLQDVLHAKVSADSYEDSVKRLEARIANSVKRVDEFEASLGEKVSSDALGRLTVELESKIKHVREDCETNLLACRCLAEERVSKHELQDIACIINTEMAQHMGSLRRELIELQCGMEGKISEEAYTTFRNHIEASIAELSAVTSLKASQQQFEELRATVTEELEPKLGACSTQLRSLQDGLKQSDTKITNCVAIAEMLTKTCKGFEETLASKASYDALKSATRELEAQIASIAAEYANSLKTEVPKLERSLANCVLTSDFKQLWQELDTITTDIRLSQQQFEELATTMCEHLESQIDGLSTRCNGFESLLEDKAAVNYLEEKLAALPALRQEVSEMISNLMSSQQHFEERSRKASEHLETQLESTSSRCDALQVSLDVKVSQESYGTDMRKLHERLVGIVDDMSSKASMQHVQETTTKTEEHIGSIRSSFMQHLSRVEMFLEEKVSRDENMSYVKETQTKIEQLLQSHQAMITKEQLDFEMDSAIGGVKKILSDLQRHVVTKASEEQFISKTDSILLKVCAVESNLICLSQEKVEKEKSMEAKFDKLSESSAQQQVSISCMRSSIDGIGAKVSECQREHQQLAQRVASAADEFAYIQKALADIVSKSHFDEALGQHDGRLTLMGTELQEKVSRNDLQESITKMNESLSQVHDAVAQRLKAMETDFPEQIIGLRDSVHQGVLDLQGEIKELNEKHQRSVERLQSNFESTKQVANRQVTQSQLAAAVSGIENRVTTAESTVNHMLQRQLQEVSANVAQKTKDALRPVLEKMSSLQETAKRSLKKEDVDKGIADAVADLQSKLGMYNALGCKVDALEATMVDMTENMFSLRGVVGKTVTGEYLEESLAGIEDRLKVECARELVKGVQDVASKQCSQEQVSVALASVRDLQIVVEGKASKCDIETAVSSIVGESQKPWHALAAKVESLQDALSTINGQLRSIEDSTGDFSTIQEKLMKWKADHKASEQRLTATVLGANNRFAEIQNVLSTKISEDRLDAEISIVQQQIQLLQGTFREKLPLGTSTNSAVSRSEDLAGISSRIDQVAHSQDALRSSIARVEERLNASEATVKSLSSDQAALTQVAHAQDALRSNIAHLKLSISSVEERLQASEGKFESLASEQAACRSFTMIPQVESRKQDAFVEEYVQMHASIDSKLSRVEKRLDDIQKSTEAHHDALEKKASTQYVESLLNDMKDRVELVLDSAIDGIEKQVEQAHAVVLGRLSKMEASHASLKSGGDSRLSS